MTEQTNEVMNGFATDDVPASTERSYKVGGRVSVTLASGETSDEARCFIARERDGVPRGMREGFVNAVRASVPVSSGQGQGTVLRHCAYFSFRGVWYFFYTQGAFPEGAHIQFTSL